MGKGKEVVIEPPSPSSYRYGGEDDPDHHRSSSPLSPDVKFSSRNAASKYDFVKVKVWLGDNADHYYVLSRFLLSRMLTVTKIPNHVAVKIALELKKLLVDNSLLDVSQSDLEANLFKLMERRGYGEEYISRYKMMTRFHHQRVPLVILVCGTACVGKSTIATQLAQRLNLPNVLQTEMVYELLRTSTDAPLSSTPVWARDFSSPEEFITEFSRECRIVRKGLAGDLKKAMKDGKPIIIEGIHLDPSIYLMDEDNKTPSCAPEKTGETTPFSVEKSTLGVDPSGKTEDSSPSVNDIHADDRNDTQENTNAEEKSSDEHLDSTQAAEGSRSIHENEVGSTKDTREGTKLSIKRAKSGGDPIIIPIVLKMAEFDHKALLEEWISARITSDKYQIKDKDRLIANLKTLQDYLCSFTSQGLTVANISATTFPQTLDWLHGYLLQVASKAEDHSLPQKGPHLPAASALKCNRSVKDVHRGIAPGAASGRPKEEKHRVEKK